MCSYFFIFKIGYFMNTSFIPFIIAAVVIAGIVLFVLNKKKNSSSTTDTASTPTPAPAPVSSTPTPSPAPATVAYVTAPKSTAKLDMNSFFVSGNNYPNSGLSEEEARAVQKKVLDGGHLAYVYLDSSGNYTVIQVNGGSIAEKVNAIVAMNADDYKAYVGKGVFEVASALSMLPIDLEKALIAKGMRVDATSRTIQA